MTGSGKNGGSVMGIGVFARIATPRVVPLSDEGIASHQMPSYPKSRTCLWRAPKSDPERWCS
eukprot:3423078-Pyramimonas_sp.AAC.1